MIMKKIVYSIFIILLTLTVNAQIDRSIRPNAGPAPKIQLGDYKLFTLDNGLKVIVVENHKIPKITYQLSLDIDPVLEADQAGRVGPGCGQRQSLQASRRTVACARLGSCATRRGPKQSADGLTPAARIHLTGIM